MIKTKDIDWIFFDVGGTLINEENSYLKHFELCEMKLRKNGIQIKKGSYRILVEKAYKENKPRPLYNVWRSFTKTEEQPKWYPQNENVFADTVSTLKYLRGFYHLGIIANRVPGLEGRLAKNNILDFFETITSSAEVNVKKPDPMIFQIALENSRSIARRSVYIGDRVDNDIVPASKASFKTIRINQGIGKLQRKDKRYPSYFLIDSLGDLKHIL